MERARVTVNGGRLAARRVPLARRAPGGTACGMRRPLSLRRAGVRALPRAIARVAARALATAPMTALATALGAPVGAQVPAAAAPAPFPRGRVVVDSLWSPSLGTTKRFVVRLPVRYDAEPARRWPVAYYLHGLWGNETNWTRAGALDRVADSLAAAGAGDAIVVMPDGDDSWYTTWNTLGTEARCRADTTRREPAASYCVPWARYDDYVARDLVARVDSAYRTRPVRAARAIAGLSMGGYGAVSLALRYPDVWSAAASHSGVLAPLLAGPRPYAAPARWADDVATLGRGWGSYWTTIPLAFGPDTAGWWARDPGRLAARHAARVAAGAAAPVALFVDVGTEDMLVDQNRAFRDVAAAARLPVTYAEWPGAHTWTYWRAHGPESLAWLLARLDGARIDGARAATGRR